MDALLQVYRMAEGGFRSFHNGFAHCGVRMYRRGYLVRRRSQRFRQRGFGEHLRYIGPHHVGAQQSVGFRIENQLDKPVSVACGRCLSGSRIGELSDFDFVTAFDGLFLRQPDHGDFRRSVDT